MTKPTIKNQAKNKTTKENIDEPQGSGNTLNKGEKSELLVFIKLLHEKKIFLSDKDLNPKKDYFNIKKITTYSMDLSYFIKNSTSVEIINKNTEKKQLINISEIVSKKTLNYIIEKIRESKNNDIEIPEFIIIRDKLNFKRASNKEKSDIVLDITKLVIKQDEGFGIKSYLGETSNILNASSYTNFIFEIQNLDKNKMDEINSIETKTKIKDRIQRIKSYGGIFKYIGPEKYEMRHNLKIIDSFMPEIIGYVLSTFYIDKIACISEIIESIHQKGDLLKKINYEDKSLLEYKIKQLLISSLLGFFPGTKWDGVYKSSGLIVMKNSGECLAFHIIDLETLKNYLFTQIKLESASTTKHEFCKIYLENNTLYIKLNLQLRFK